MTINIQASSSPAELIVYYDKERGAPYKNTKKAELFQKTSLPRGRRIYHAELTDLEQNTTYYFTINDPQGTVQKEYSFRTLPKDNSPLLFIEGGDWENTSAACHLAKKAASFAPHAVFLGGDYPSHVLGPSDMAEWDFWLDTYAQSMVTPEGHLIPMIMAIGNHEVIGGYEQGKEQVPFFLHFFRQGTSGKSYFSLPIGERIKLFVLDSGHTEAHAGNQRDWLEKELKEGADYPIKIALYHVPLYPSVRFAKKNLAYFLVRNFTELFKNKHAANKLFSKGSELGRKHWLPLFDHYDLTVAFEHHDQALKRTKLLKRGRVHPRGTLYLGDGGWGCKVQPPPIQGIFSNEFAHMQAGQHFFWVIEVHSDKIVYSAVNASGELLDHFIQKISDKK